MATDYRAYFDALVRHETRLWNSIDRSVVAEGGLHLGRISYLRLLTGHAELRLQDLVGGLGITMGAASRLTDRLELDGLVERVPNPADRRSTLVRATPAGADALARSEVLFERTIAALLGGISGEQLQDLTRTLAAILPAENGEGVS